MGVLVDPVAVIPEGGDLLFTQGLQLLEEVDTPGGEANHFVTGGLVLVGGGVDETVQVL